MLRLLLVIAYFILISNQSFAYLPDTAQNQDNTNVYGEDSDYIINQQLFQKLDNQGNELYEYSTKWSMVKDLNTGLIWEVKTNDNSIHDKDNKYFYNRNDVNNDVNESTVNFFINKLNNENFGGFNDWRLPSILELNSIIDYGRLNPSINKLFFPMMMSSTYWSSTITNDNPEKIWCLIFGNGHIFKNTIDNKCFTIAVRGMSKQVKKIIDNNDGTITDSDTGLMWQKTNNESLEWENAISYCESLNLEGYNDWRMPNIKELISIINNKYFLNANREFFQAFNQDLLYWSSTSYSAFEDNSWVVNQRGNTNNELKTNKNFVLAVRGGQNIKNSHIIISEPSQGDTWIIGNEKIVKWDLNSNFDRISIAISRKGGLVNTYENIAENITNTGYFKWLVKGEESFNCFLRIETKKNEQIFYSYKGLFSISKSLPDDNINTKYISSISINSPVTQMYIGNTVKLETLAHYSDGTSKPLTNVNWNCLNQDIAIISQNGELKALSSGEATVNAEFQSISETIIIYVEKDNIEYNINTCPFFTKGTDIIIINNLFTPQYYFKWAKEISSGINEENQKFEFYVDCDKPDLFENMPQIYTNGTLIVNPLKEAVGTANLKVYLQDNGGNENGGCDKSAIEEFQIVVNNNGMKLIVNKTGRGEILVNNKMKVLAPWNKIYQQNEIVLLNAIPANGKVFTYWSGEIGDNINSINPIQIKMDMDRTIEAHFVTKDDNIIDNDNIIVEYKMKKGWNLISIPVSLDNNSLNYIFPDASVAYSFSHGSYDIAYTLEPGKGYFIDMKCDKDILISGKTYILKSIQLYKGWNLIGAFNNDSLTSLFQNKIIEVMYKYEEGSYTKVNKMETKSGYWLRAIENCNILNN